MQYLVAEPNRLCYVICTRSGDDPPPSQLMIEGVDTQLCSWRRSKWTSFFTPKRSWSTFQCELFLRPKDEEQTRRHAPARTDIEIEDNKTVNFDMCKPPSGVALCLCSIQPIHEIGLKGSLQPICSHTGLCFGTGCCGRRLEVFATGCVGDVVGYQEWWW